MGSMNETTDKKAAQLWQQLERGWFGVAKTLGHRQHGDPVVRTAPLLERVGGVLQQPNIMEGRSCGRISQRR